MANLIPDYMELQIPQLVIHAHKMDPSQDHEGEYFSRWDKGSQVEYVNPE